MVIHIPGAGWRRGAERCCFSVAVIKHDVIGMSRWRGRTRVLAKMKAATKYAPAPTDASGLSALFPKDLKKPKEAADYDTTVLTVGGEGWPGIVVAILHLVCWIITIGLSGGTMGSLGGVSAASDAAKATSTLAFTTQWFIVIAIVCHASFCQKGERGAAIATVFLTAFVLFGLLLNATVFTYCLSLADSDPWRISVAAMVFSVLSSSMVLSFMVEWSNRGTMVFTTFRGDTFGGGGGKAPLLEGASSGDMKV